MYVRHYGLLLGFVASASLGLAGCGSDHAASGSADTVAAAAPPPQVATRKVDADNTDQTLWTWLGLAKRHAPQNLGPQTGSTVSPELWEATHDALKFAGIESDDPVTGLVMTKWYSPPDKPDERLKVSVFILSRALRSDSVALTIERETRSAGGDWQKTPVARETVDGLDNAILLRARQIHAERYREKLDGAS